MSARKKQAVRKKKAARKNRPPGPKAAARKKKPGGSGAQESAPQSQSSLLPNPLGIARSAATSVADRLVELVEQAAASTVRYALDSGGREIASWLPESDELRHEAGIYLRDLREVAGLTIDELADAVELEEVSLLKKVEAGTSTLSFELILRLAAVLARHDPVPFILRLVRTYNPVIGQLLEDWGIGRLPLQLEREREFVNILRGHDVVRDIPDDDFKQILAFTRSAFETALHFATEPRRPPGS
jgi:transcriptional regulator with XRE-family HTH domain